MKRETRKWGKHAYAWFICKDCNGKLLMHVIFKLVTFVYGLWICLKYLKVITRQGLDYRVYSVILVSGNCRIIQHYVSMFYYSVKVKSPLDVFEDCSANFCSLNLCNMRDHSFCVLLHLWMWLTLMIRLD